jgi:arylsulfatase A-like enzyme
MKNISSILVVFVLFNLLLTGCGHKAETPKKPNILFAIADDASWKHFGAYGCNWVKTPGFDKVAGSGILFTRCYTPNAKCAPSRSSILTGRNSWQLEEAANHSPLFPAKLKPTPRRWAKTGILWAALQKAGRRAIRGKLTV